MSSTPSATQIAAALKDVRDQSSFINKLLVDTLHWDIRDGVEQIEDISYGWSQDELRAGGLDRHIVDGQVWQIQPFKSEQPWGIFLLEFKNADAFVTGRGLIGPLRAVLRGLVPSRRKSPTEKSWKREHLLFLCTHNYEHFRVAYFKAPPEKTATALLAAFGWGPDIPARTACEFNLPALAWPDNPSDSAAWVAQWASAFDVEKVTKKFYDEYAATFAEVERLIGDKCRFDSAEDLRMFTQTLFNRLMFLRFIERKGWLDFHGRHDYLRALFEAGGIGGKSLYHSRIRPLFFEALAVEGKQESAAVGRVPFLNGGLFEETDLDRAAKDVPDNALSPMIGPTGLFYRYNFTIEESTPLDIEVAVDPEMLGKVFEELVTGRHESGSYYTPRPVVSFMCREALKGYLADKTAAAAEAVARLVDEHVVEGLRETHAREVLDALDDLKAVDPACGSGAYLLGLLHELVAIYRSLYSERLVRDPRSLYDLKLRIISQNLYGVDIDPFATNIAMLRLWLSLAVEAEEPVALPNLDFKIETGDSLLAPDPQKVDTLFRDRLRTEADALVSLKREFFGAHGEKKENCRRTIEAIEAKLASDVRDEVGENVIDWRIHFAEAFAHGRHGFDIVVANPPYGLLNKRQNQRFGYAISKESAKKLASSPEYEPVVRGMVNICTLFVRRSFSLLRRGGVFVEIFPLSFACDWSFGPLRQYVFGTHAIRSVHAFPERDNPKLRVFESAKMSVCILVTRCNGAELDSSFELSIHDGPDPAISASTVSLTPSEVALLDENQSIPLVTQVEFEQLATIYAHSRRLGEIGKCYTGEVDLTLCREFIRENPALAVLHKGAIIDRYRIRERMSQGVIENLDSKAYLRAKGARATSSAWHHKDPRIVLQGITGINERVRLKMTLLKPAVFLANSANYIRLKDASEVDYLFLLGVLNSSIANRVFKCFSTNSNVNGYEVDNLPVPRASLSEKKEIADLVQKCLIANGVGCEKWDDEIDARVKELFGLGQSERAPSPFQ